MKSNYFLSGLLLAGILVGGCQSSLEPFGSIELAPFIKPVSDIQQPQSTEVEQFAPGSTLSTYVWTEALFGTSHVSNHLSLIEEDGKCSSNTPLQWMGQKASHYFLSVSPASSTPITDFQNMEFKMNYSDMKKNDLMVAINDNGLNASVTEVPLEFHHLMAQIHITLELSPLLEDNHNQFNVSAKTYSRAEIDLTSEDPKFQLKGGQEYIRLQQNKTNPLEYQAYILPHDNLNDIIVRESSGHTSMQVKIPKEILLKSGMRTSIVIKVGPQIAEVEDVTIGDWVPATDYDQNIEAPEPLGFSIVEIEGKAALDRSFGLFTDELNNIKVTNTNRHWVSEQEILLNPDMTQYNFFAYSPYQNVLVEEYGHPGYFRYSLPLDQSNKIPELLIWNSQISKTDLLKQGLNINFSNQLSFFKLNLKASGDLANANITDLKVEGVLTEGYFGFNKQDGTAELVCKPETDENERKSIIMLKNSNSEFECTLIPQSNVPLIISFLINGSIYEWVAENPVSFQRNKVYQLELSL